MRFITLSQKLSSDINKSFDNFVINSVGFGLNKSISRSILEKSFNYGIKSQDRAFSGVYSPQEFITLDLLKSYSYSAFMRSKEDFKHKANILLFKEKTSQENNETLIDKCVKSILTEESSIFSRIISTMINDAYQEGRAAGIKRSVGHTNPYVFKRPQKTSCNFCKSLYLKKDKVTPIIFKLNEMVEAGINNDGRHHHRPENTAWKAVVGSVHPWCRCQLHYLKKGNSFDSEGNVVEYKSESFYW
jgi:hypothetical protein